MDVALLVCRLVLAAVFLTAAVAKALDLPGARRAFAQLGVPEAAVPVAVVLVPLAELAVAVALVPVATAWAASLAAVALLVAFTTAVGAAVARGTEAECHCFGRVSSEPVGVGTLVRNAGLLGLATFVAVAGADGAGASATNWIGDLSGAETVVLVGGVVLAAGVIFNGAFLLQLLRQNGRLWTEIEELRAAVPREPALRPPEIGIGELAPSFALPDMAGREVALDDLLDEDRGLILVFSDPGCHACDRVLPAVAQMQHDPQADPWPVLINFGDADDNRAKVSEHGLETVLVHDDVDLPHSLGISGTPGAVALDAEGRIVSPPALGTEKVSELLAQVAGPRLVQVEGTG